MTLTLFSKKTHLASTKIQKKPQFSIPQKRSTFEQANKPAHKTNEAQKLARVIAIFAPRSVVIELFGATGASFLALQAERNISYWKP